jgi:hypothetical protein
MFWHVAGRAELDLSTSGDVPGRDEHDPVLERRSENAPLAEARGSDLPVKRLLKPAPVEGGRAPFVLVRTESEPGTEGAGFNLRPGLFPGRTHGEHCPWLQPGVRSHARAG